jgi:hypothetical protein
LYLEVPTELLDTEHQNWTNIYAYLQAMGKGPQSYDYTKVKNPHGHMYLLGWLRG